MRYDPAEARRERRDYLDALPPPDAAFLEAARAAVLRAGILPWDEFRTRWESEMRSKPSDRAADAAEG